jgi:uncharacterized protein involved in outer membrane biogenesis
MKTIKTISKIAALFFMGLILALFIVPQLFRKDILAFIQNDINKNLNATVGVYDVHLSMFRSFPDLRITLDSLSITGKDNFEGITLYKADKTYLDLSLMSLIKKDITPTINYIQLDNPVINILIVNDTLSNYSIMPSDNSDTTALKYELALKKYTLNNARIFYHDYEMDMELTLEEFHHEGSGDFTQDVFDLKTKSTAQKVTFTYDDMTYLRDVNSELEADITVDFLQDRYTLKDNRLRLNEFQLKGDGFVQLDQDNIMMEALLTSVSQDFRSLISLLPAVYLKDFEKIKTKGQASVEAEIKGVYNSLSGSMPGFDVRINIQDGYLKYPELPSDISQFFANIRVKASRPDYKDMNIQIPDFRCLFGKESLEGKLLVENLTGNQSMEGHLKADVNLSHIPSVIPLDDIETLTGEMKGDMTFKATMNDIDNENYQNIVFDGTAHLKDLVYKALAQPRISISEAVASASPSRLSFNADKMNLGKSDVSLKGTILNPLAFVSTQKEISVDVSGHSKFLDLNEWISDETGSQAGHKEPFRPDTDVTDILDKSNLKVTWDSEKILWEKYEIQNLVLKGSVAKNSILIDDFRAVFEGNDVAIKGIVTDAYDYIFNSGVLAGQIDLYSRNMDLDRFMTLIPHDNGTEAPMTIIPVPSNVDVSIHSKIDKLKYSQMVMSDFDGVLSIKDKTLSIEDMTTSTLGGKIKMQGLYSTENERNPDFNLKLDLKSIKFLDAFQTFEIVKVAAPISQYIKGLFNTTLVMQGKLGDQMIPDLSTLDASGFLETIHGSLENFEPLQKASSLLGVRELRNLDISDTKNWFEIKDGTIELKPFDKNIKGIDMTISGFHGLKKEMSYTLNLNIPRELLKESQAGKQVDIGLSFLEKEAQKLGLPFKQGTHVRVDVLLGGTLRNPTVKVIPRASEGSSVSDAISDKLTETETKLKDTIRKEVEKRTTQIKDTLTKMAEKEIDKAKAKAEKELDKAADSIKNVVKREVLSRADSLARGWIQDTVTEKVKDILDEKAKDEVDKIKNKLKDFNPLKKKGQ